MSMREVERYRHRMDRAGNLQPAASSPIEAARQLDYVVDADAPVLVWKSNGQHPHDDMLAAWLILQAITEDQARATTEARAQAMDAFTAAYRANPPQPSAEQMAEMRAAFGPGERVVNVVTGQSYQL